MNKSTLLLCCCLIFSHYSAAEEEMLVDRADDFDFEFHEEKKGSSNKPSLWQRLNAANKTDDNLKKANYSLEQLSHPHLQQAQASLYQQMLKACPSGFVKQFEKLTSENNKTMLLSYQYSCLKP